MKHEIVLPKPLFLSYLFNTNHELIVDEEDVLSVGDELELIEADGQRLKPTGRKLTKVVYQIRKPSLYKGEETYMQLTIVNTDQYNRLNKLPGLQT